MKTLIGALAFLFFLMTPAAHAEQPIPPLGKGIVDTTHWLSSQEVLDLEKQVVLARTQHNVQIAVLIIPSAKPEVIEQYSIRVADAWKVGKKGVDNGVLITIFRQDHEFRTDVGYGLEGTLPDILTRRLMEKYMQPNLKADKPYDALVAMIGAIEVEVGKDPSTRQKEKSAESSDEVYIPFFDELNSKGKIVAIVLGIIGGILLLIGGYGESGAAFIVGLALPPIGGFIIGLLVNISMCFMVGVVAFIIALIIALGITFAVAGGGKFGGGGASSHW